MKKLIVIVIVLCMIVSITACNKESDAIKSDDSTPTAEKAGQEATANPEEDDATDLSEKEVLTIEALHVIIKDRLPERPTIFDDYLLENYKVKLDYVDVQQSAANDKITLMFASDSYPEMFINIIDEEAINIFAIDGYFRNINDWFDPMPNFCALWNEEDFNYMLDLESASDGMLYMIPSKTITPAQITWIYRKDIFDELNLDFPSTVTDLYDCMTAIKTNKEGNIPYITKAGVSGILMGLNSAYFTMFGEYEHPVTGEFIPFGEVTDDFRQCVIWANKWYTEDLIPKDFATLSSQQYQEIFTLGDNAIQYTYCSREIWGNGLVQPNIPEAQWVKKMDGGVTAYPEYGFLYTKNPPSGLSCYAFTDKISDEKMSRMISFMDWLTTDEGAVWWTMGVEGVTWEYDDNNNVVYMEHIFEPTNNPEGTELWEYGLGHDYRIYTPREFAAQNSYTLNNLELGEALESASGATYFPQYAFKYTVDEGHQARRAPERHR